MASHITRLAIGNINGTNKLFTTTVPYRPNSVQPILNGQWLKDAWTEQGGVKVFMQYPPEPGDILQLQYIPL